MAALGCKNWNATVLRDSNVGFVNLLLRFFVKLSVVIVFVAVAGVGVEGCEFEALKVSSVEYASKFLLASGFEIADVFAVVVT